MYLCFVNSRIGLCGLWVGVCIEGVESKVPWVSSCMGFVPEAAVCLPEGTTP